MPRYHFDKPRLFLTAALAAGEKIELARDQSNYLRNVLRLGDGAEVLVFNGVEGEWLARLGIAGRKAAYLELQECLRPQTPPGNIDYLFAPIKHARLDYMVQKATEMGAGALMPVITRRTQVSRVNLDRMRANAVEAAEQCGILNIPIIEQPRSLEDCLQEWRSDRPLIVCDEDAPQSDPLAVLKALPGANAPDQRFAVLIGPEGGFAPEERASLTARPQVIVINLGPRILRADTAAVAAMTIIQAAIGDW